MEMEKEREYGGIKLINTRLKSVTPKMPWLISLITDEGLGYHLRVFRALVGEQRGGGLRPKDIILIGILSIPLSTHERAFGLQLRGGAKRMPRSFGTGLRFPCVIIQ